MSPTTEKFRKGRIFRKIVEDPKNPPPLPPPPTRRRNFSNNFARNGGLAFPQPCTDPPVASRNGGFLIPHPYAAAGFHTLLIHPSKVLATSQITFLLIQLSESPWAPLSVEKTASKKVSSSWIISLQSGIFLPFSCEKLCGGVMTSESGLHLRYRDFVK